MDGKPTLFIDETRYDPQWILRIPALIPGKGNIVEPGADDADDDTDDETVDQILFFEADFFCDQKPIYICEGDAADDADRIPIDVSSKTVKATRSMILISFPATSTPSRTAQPARNARKATMRKTSHFLCFCFIFFLLLSF